MSYQPGDEKLVRKFTTPKPNINPLIYDEWITNADGAMTQMMMEMLAEMMPMMMQNHGGMNHQMHQKLMEQLKLKLTHGIQEKEIYGSFMDAMREIMPDMQMSPEAIQPGKINPVIIEVMLAGWQEKYSDLPDIDSISMDEEPDATEFLLQSK